MEIYGSQSEKAQFCGKGGNYVDNKKYVLLPGVRGVGSRVRRIFGLQNTLWVVNPLRVK